jgi:hypothetical protein
MRCIWKGDLRRTWNTLRLLCIIENLQHWIVMHFRPWVSSCIDQWQLAMETAKREEIGDIADIGRFSDLLMPSDGEDDETLLDSYSESDSEEDVVQENAAKEDYFIDEEEDFLTDDSSTDVDSQASYTPSKRFAYRRRN